MHEISSRLAPVTTPLHSHTSSCTFTLTCTHLCSYSHLFFFHTHSHIILYVCVCINGKHIHQDNKSAKHKKDLYNIASLGSTSDIITETKNTPWTNFVGLNDLLHASLPTVGTHASTIGAKLGQLDPKHKLPSIQPTSINILQTIFKTWIP